MLVPSENNKEMLHHILGSFCSSSGLIVSAQDPKGMMSSRIKQRRPPSFGKGQALACSGSDVPCLYRCHPMALHPCGGEARLFIRMLWISNLRPLKAYLGSKSQRALCFRREWAFTGLRGPLASRAISFHPHRSHCLRFTGAERLCDMPKATRLLGDQGRGYLGLSCHHTWLCAETSQPHS